MIYIRSRLVDDETNGFSDPWPASFIPYEHIPREGEQFLTPDDRALMVTVVEHHFGAVSKPSLPHVHLFCVEFPKGAKRPSLRDRLRRGLRQLSRDV